MPETPSECPGEGGLRCRKLPPTTQFAVYTARLRQLPHIGRPAQCTDALMGRTTGPGCQPIPGRFLSLPPCQVLALWLGALSLRDWDPESPALVASEGLRLAQVASLSAHEQQLRAEGVSIFKMHVQTWPIFLWSRILPT